MSEQQEQKELFRWAALHQNQYPELEWLYSVPNAGKRTAWERGQLLETGLKSGVPDICLPIPRGGFGALYIEMKFGKNKPTDNQSYWLNGLQRVGNLTVVCHYWHEAAAIIMQYLKGEHKNG